MFARNSARSVTFLRIAALLTGLFLVPALALGQTFVQVNSNTAASAATVAVTYTAAEAAGNLNVVVVGWSDTTSSVASVTDDNTNTYKLVGTTAGHGLSQAIYYAPNIAVTPTRHSHRDCNFQSGRRLARRAHPRVQRP